MEKADIPFNRVDIQGNELEYIVDRYLLQGSPVQGFPFSASIIAIFSGAQLLAI